MLGYVCRRIVGLFSFLNGISFHKTNLVVFRFWIWMKHWSTVLYKNQKMPTFLSQFSFKIRSIRLVNIVGIVDMFSLNYDEQNYPLCRLNLLVKTFRHCQFVLTNKDLKLMNKRRCVGYQSQEILLRKKILPSDVSTRLTQQHKQQNYPRREGIRL